jgi:hypothetical protein
MESKVSNKARFSIFNLDLSEILILISNLVPLFGALFFKWSLYSIIYLYLLEMTMLGFYLLLKIFITGFNNAKEKSGISRVVDAFKVTIFISILAIIPLIVILMVLSNLSSIVYAAELKIRLIENGNLVKPNFRDFILPISILFLSHTFSFFYNFMGKKEYNNKMTIPEIIISIYIRFAYLWAIIAAAMITAPIIFLLGELVFKTSASLYVLAVFITSLFIIIKILLDLKAHRKEHNTYQQLQ